MDSGQESWFFWARIITQQLKLVQNNGSTFLRGTEVLRDRPNYFFGGLGFLHIENRPVHSRVVNARMKCLVCHSQSGHTLVDGYLNGGMNAARHLNHSGVRLVHTWKPGHGNIPHERVHRGNRIFPADL
ncbi:unnamed protein product [Sphacelaria rigidula]